MRLHHIKALLATAAFAVPILVTVPVWATAVTQFDFTTAELSNKWGPERIAPSGGVSSLSTYHGRNNVAQIGINSEHPSSSAASLDDPYYWTEGIKTSKGPADNFSVPGNFGQSVQVDLYLDAAWNNTAVRAGLWTVGDNNAGGTDAGNFPFGIIEFANVSGYKGFRIWDDTTGWKQVTGFTSFGKWVTFNITLNPTAHQYRYSINGTQVATSASPAVSTYLYSVILNQRNFGKDPQAGLNTPSYTVHWQGGIESDGSKDHCKNDGWKNSTSPKFKNQGDCVSSVASKGNAKGNPQF